MLPMPQGTRPTDRKLRRLGIFGGAFDPPHQAHVALVTAAMAQLALDQVRDIAATGVDRISIGRLTKDVRATDYSMRVLSAF